MYTSHRCVRLLALVLLLHVPFVAQAQEYTFTTIDLPATGGAPGRIINLVGIANDGTMAGDDNSPNGLGSRISPTLDVTPVTCLPGTFDRYPFASRLGPEVVAMNNALTVVGNDEGLVALHGFQQTLAGDCSFFLFPGSIGTLFTGIDDPGRIVGQYWNDPAVEFGLLRFHAFVKDDDTLTPLTNGISNDVLWPTGINAAGDIIGYAFRDVQPDNSYIYQAFYYSGGTFTWLDSPGGEDVWLTGLNNAGQVTAVLHPQGVVGGPAWLYDHITATWTMLPVPTPDTDVILPRAINDHGALVGFYAEFFPEPPPFGHSAFHQFLATPVPPPIPEPPPKPKKFLRFLKKHRQHIRERLRDALQDASAHRWQHPLLARHWWPVLDEDGSVCLTDGVRVIGRRP
jgi:hypothetical protein